MANIRKRGNTYQVTVSSGYDIKGKQIRESISFTPDQSKTPKQQQKELDKFVFDFEQKVKNGFYLDGEKITLEEYAKSWIETYAKKALEPTTYISYIQYLESHILPSLGHLKLAEIKRVHLTNFYNGLTEEGARHDKKQGGYSQGTIKKCRAILSSIFSEAVDQEILSRNPCTSTRKRKQPVKQNKDIKYFTLEQAEIFLKALDIKLTATYKAHDRIDDTGKVYHINEYTESRNIPTQFKVFFNLAIFGGFRRGELIALTWDDIDLINETVTINKSTCNVKVDGEYLTKAPKTETSNRTIKIPSTVIKLIRKYKQEQNEYKLSIGNKWQQNSNYVFTQWNGIQMHLDSPYRVFKKIIKEYNSRTNDKVLRLPEISLHGLRHTSATILIAENVNVKTVSARLGHAETSTTMNIYAHSLQKLDEQASDIFEKLIGKQA